ncbi:MAG: ABC transporter ATP-binding protein [Dermatophilaceae bacterium]
MSLDLKGITHRYGRICALDDVSVNLSPGITALLGVNGAGKSTLLGVAAGIVAPMRGTVRVGGFDLHSRSSRNDACRRVNLMPQAASFPSRMPVEDIVSYLTWMKGWPSKDATDRAGWALDQVGLGKRSRSRFGALSGGMARRVALAQAIATEPEVLLLDEPTTGLDPAQRKAMVDLVGGLGESGVTVLLSSHVVEDIEDLARAVIVLHGGTVRFSGPVEGLAALADPGTRRSPLESGFFRVIEDTGR